MSDISQIQVNGTTYDLCDATARTDIANLQDSVFPTTITYGLRNMRIVRSNSTYFALNLPKPHGAIFSSASISPSTINISQDNASSTDITITNIGVSTDSSGSENIFLNLAVNTTSAQSGFINGIVILTINYIY